jgi:pimeloyl-ACP methyl ester carboxylesterase
VTQRLTIGPHELEIRVFVPTPQIARGPTIVLLHEGLGCVSLWRDFPQTLANATGAQVVAYSRYGYGQSTPLPAGVRNVRAADYMHVEAIDVLPRVLTALNLSRPLLVGHSDGGTIALIFAAYFPDALAGACVMAPHCFVEDISVASIAQARATFESTDLATRLAKHHRDPVATFYGWNDVWLSDAFRTMNIEALLPRITCPMVAIQGEGDEYGTMRQIDVIAQNVPTAQVMKLPACGHAPWKDQPEAVLREIVRLHADVFAA